jgi:argininosuccinate lyase
LSTADFRAFSEAFGDDVTSVLKLDTALAARKGIGAPAPDNVNARLAHWRKVLSVN